MNYLDLESLYNKPSKEMNVYNANEAFIKGTLFKSLYEPYKNYIPKEVSSNNNQAKMMLEVQKYKAVVHDLTLYLDVFPEDEKAIELRKKYLKISKEVCDNYNKAYSPISLAEESINEIPFKWSTTKWPWEMN